jgi:hypothetical protein
MNSKQNVVESDGDGDRESSTKVIHLPDPKKEKEKRNGKKGKGLGEMDLGQMEEKSKMPKERKERVITRTFRWQKEISEKDFTLENQMELLKLMDPSEYSKNPKARLLFRQIQRKIDGYRAQDIDKGKYEIEVFIRPAYVIQKLLDSELHCFYCKEPVKLWYKEVRDPKQWTLERIQNQKGHIMDNVEIACLLCNIRRRTMYYEKYRFTKQMVITKVS